ncbi:hypothetical protein NMY22_g4188 [Coprinellus aureogranulatus]|nr:hypothetical protein NMY22_g4188 [Coprinellus aureogranulatus]
MNPQLTAEEDAIISSLLAKIEQGLYGFFTKYNCEARLDPRSFGHVYPIVASELDPTIRNLPREPAALRLLIEEMHCRMLEYEVQIGDDEGNRSLEDWMNIARVMTLSAHIHRVAGDLTCSLGSHMYTALSQGMAEIARRCTQTPDPLVQVWCRRADVEAEAAVLGGTPIQPVGRVAPVPSTFTPPNNPALAHADRPAYYDLPPMVTVPPLTRPIIDEHNTRLLSSSQAKIYAENPSNALGKAFFVTQQDSMNDSGVKDFFRVDGVFLFPSGGPIVYISSEGVEDPETAFAFFAGEWRDLIDPPREEHLSLYEVVGN